MSILTQSTEITIFRCVIPDFYCTPSTCDLSLLLKLFLNSLLPLLEIPFFIYLTHAACKYVHGGAFFEGVHERLKGGQRKLTSQTLKPRTTEVAN